MNTIEIKIHSCREGILTISSNQMTVISDQQITAGDIIKSDLHKYKNENRHWHLMVDEILEERPSRVSGTECLQRGEKLNTTGNDRVA